VKIRNKKKWKKEEDDLLIYLVQKNYEKNWREVSKNFANKTALQCFSRYKRIRPGIIKGSWGKDEDILILELVKRFGKLWSKIAKIMGSRNGKQIRDRFINILDPQINKGRFSEEEDALLINLYLSNGPKWAHMSTFFVNRTADMIKNRFHSSIKKTLMKEKKYENILNFFENSEEKALEDHIMYQRHFYTNSTTPNSITSKHLSFYPKVNKLENKAPIADQTFNVDCRKPYDVFEGRLLENNIKLFQKKIINSLNDNSEYFSSLNNVSNGDVYLEKNQFTTNAFYPNTSCDEFF